MAWTAAVGCPLAYRDNNGRIHGGFVTRVSGSTVERVQYFDIADSKWKQASPASNDDALASNNVWGKHTLA